MRKSTGVIAAAHAVLFMLAVPQAQAAFIVDGNYVRGAVDANVFPGSGTGGVFPDVDPVFADTGVRDFVFSGWSASGRGQAGIVSGLDLRAISTSTAPPAGSFSPPSSSLNATAAWRDVLIATGPGAPAALDFNFSVHGVLTVSSTTPSGIGDNFSQSIISMAANNNIINFAAPSLLGNLRARVRSLEGVLTTEVGTGWDSASLVPLGPNQYEFFGSFTWTSPRFDFTFPPASDDAPFGAYYLGVGLAAYTSNVGGTSTTDAFNTLSLDSITTPGGALISADDFMFESGATVNAVIPVPGALLLMCSGLLGYLGFVWRSGAIRRATA